MTRPILDWEALEDSPSLKTIGFLLETVPDMQALVRRRA